MSAANDDGDLRERYAELVESAAARAPAFDVLWHRAEERAVAARRDRRLLFAWTAAAAALVLAAGLALYVSRNSKSPPTPAGASADAVVNWQSPTASLLRSPGHPPFVRQPILSSLLDGVNPAPVQFETRK